jgi:4-hydroxybutyrate CoA-transferase
MFSDGVVDLVEAGVITGARKTIHPGKIVSCFMMGSKRLYEFANDNPVVEMMPAEYTNDTSIIRRNYRMVAINSAMQVDLTGQICAESIGYRLHSGVGGQMDFMRGAALSDGGKAIIALSSTAGNGKYSRIVPLLDVGAGVTTTRAHVQYVVTEYGIAYMRGNSVRERAIALMEISHPKFRDELARYAFERKWLPSQNFFVPERRVETNP